MNEIKYTCERGDGHTLSFYPGGGGKSGFRISHGSSDDFIDLSPEETTDLARRLAENVGLTVEPEPFKRNAAFEDIRKGDLVRTERMEDDIAVTRTGVVASQAQHAWYTSEGWNLYVSAPDTATTILSRPEPPELPTTPGAVVVVGTKTYALEERTADLIWRNLADPTDFYSYEWPGDNDWTATGLKVVVA